MITFYGSIEGFTAYHTARDNDIPATVDDDDIKAALLVASEWIDARYMASFAGRKTGGRDQVREWPRDGVADVYGYAIASDAIPREIENAAYESALIQLVTPGSLSVNFTPGKFKRVSVDGAVSVEYASYGSSEEVQTQFTIIDGILFPILTGASSGFSSYSGASART